MPSTYFMERGDGAEKNRCKRLSGGTRRRGNRGRVVVFAKSLAVSTGLALIAIANGTFRVGVLELRMTSGAAHVISAIMLCVLVLAFTWVTISWIAPQSLMEAIAIGIFWVVLTVGFEFGFGLLVSLRPWQELLAEYDVSRGRLWALALVTIAAAPYLTARFRGFL